MPEPRDRDELELVRRAILEGRTTRGCCEWNAKAADRLRERPPYENFVPDKLRAWLCDFVAEHPTTLRQVPEKRPEYQDRKFYYKVLLPIPELPKPLFVELVLFNCDPEYPIVLIVNAHEQRR